jgi:branched-chain amino acid transport system substrate-binding protein
MVVAVPWDFLANLNSPFVRSSRALWGADVNWRSAMAYDATLALIEALKQDPTRQGIQAALSAGGFSVSGATGQVRFLPSGDRNQAMQLVRVQPGDRTGFGYEFVPAQ